MEYKDCSNMRYPVKYCQRHTGPWRIVLELKNSILSFHHITFPNVTQPLLKSRNLSSSLTTSPQFKNFFLSHANSPIVAQILLASRSRHQTIQYTLTCHAPNHTGCWKWLFPSQMRTHTCKKRGIAGIYPRKLFWIFRKILGWEREISTAPKPSPEVAPSKMEVAPS